MKNEYNKKWITKINSAKQSIGTNEYIKKIIKQSIQQETWLTSLKSLLPFWIQNIILVKNEIIIYTSNKNVNSLITFLYYHTNTLFKTVTDITAIDYPDQKLRFDVVYILLSSIYSIIYWT